MKGDRAALAAISAHALWLRGEHADYDALLAMTGDADFVLLGESTHGTHEFYRMRREITARLVAEQGFDAVAVEADWPDAHRLDRYVRGSGNDLKALQAFADFQRFPAWMWRNHDVLGLVEWLHAHNRALPAPRRAGFYGIDLYSLHRSARAVVDYLDGVDPAQAAVARRTYACLDHVREPQEYGYQAAAGLRPDCEGGVRATLRQLLQPVDVAPALDPIGADERFHAQANARLVVNAEAYYRAMYGSRANTWNLRDEHMADTLLGLRAHLRRTGRRGRIVVWAHNSHLGDARATEMGRQGEWNVGQLLRERAGEASTLLVGFTTYTGHVTAADDWDAPARQRWVRPALPGSCEALFHQVVVQRLVDHEDCTGRLFLPMTGKAAQALSEDRLERAIGVVYRPRTERHSHYFQASLSRQFDAVFHVDQSTAVEPFDLGNHWRHAETPESPETWPTGL